MATSGTDLLVGPGAHHLLLTMADLISALTISRNSTPRDLRPLLSSNHTGLKEGVTAQLRETVDTAPDLHHTPLGPRPPKNSAAIKPTNNPPS